MNGTENRFILEWTATYRAELVCFELCDLRWRRVAMVISLCVSHDWLSSLNGAVTANTKAVSRRKWRIYFVFYLTGREKPEGETENKPLRVVLSMTMTFTCKCGITLIDLCAKDQFCLHLSNVWTWLWRWVCVCVHEHGPDGENVKSGQSLIGLTGRWVLASSQCLSHVSCSLVVKCCLVPPIPPVDSPYKTVLRIRGLWTLAYCLLEPFVNILY